MTWASPMTMFVLLVRSRGIVPVWPMPSHCTVQ